MVLWLAVAVAVACDVQGVRCKGSRGDASVSVCLVFSVLRAYGCLWLCVRVRAVTGRMPFVGWWFVGSFVFFLSVRKWVGVWGW